MCPLRSLSSEKQDFQMLALSRRSVQLTAMFSGAKSWFQFFANFFTLGILYPPSERLRFPPFTQRTWYFPWHVLCLRGWAGLMTIQRSSDGDVSSHHAEGSCRIRALLRGLWASLQLITHHSPHFDGTRWNGHHLLFLCDVLYKWHGHVSVQGN